MPTSLQSWREPKARELPVRPQALQMAKQAARVKKIELEIEEVSEEIKAEPDTETFQSEGSESAGSEGEFERP